MDFFWDRFMVLMLGLATTFTGSWMARVHKMVFFICTSAIGSHAGKVYWLALGWRRPAFQCHIPPFVLHNEYITLLNCHLESCLPCWAVRAKKKQGRMKEPVEYPLQGWALRVVLAGMSCFANPTALNPTTPISKASQISPLGRYQWLRFTSATQLFIDKGAKERIEHETFVNVSSWNWYTITVDDSIDSDKPRKKTGSHAVARETKSKTQPPAKKMPGTHFEVKEYQLWVLSCWHPVQNSVSPGQLRWSLWNPRWLKPAVTKAPKITPMSPYLCTSANAQHKKLSTTACVVANIVLQTSQLNNTSF